MDKGEKIAKKRFTKVAAPNIEAVTTIRRVSGCMNIPLDSFTVPHSKQQSFPNKTMGSKVYRKQQTSGQPTRVGGIRLRLKARCRDTFPIYFPNNHISTRL
jgi:hypothetical protein